jgi:peptidoglycan-N-acetylglucosamine deacetylase
VSPIVRRARSLCAALALASCGAPPAHGPEAATALAQAHAATTTAPEPARSIEVEPAPTELAPITSAPAPEVAALAAAAQDELELVEASSVPVDPRAGATRPDLGRGMVMTGRTAHRLVLFTFDDGPHPFHTPQLLAHLARTEVRGTFFVNAHRFDAETGWYAECANVLRDVAAAGHVIASHGRDHELTAGLTGEALDDQVVGAEEIFLRVLGVRPWLFRPPGGVRSEATDAYLSERGYTQVLWTLHTGDYETRSADEVVRNFRASIVNREHTETPGGIAVIHDTHPWGVAAFPRMIRYLRRRNCELLDRGEELYDIVDDPSLFFVARPEGASASDEAPLLVLPPEVLAERQARLRERETIRCREDSD